MPIDDEDGEVPELTRADIRKMRPLREVLPHLADLAERGTAGKEEVTLYIDTDVLKQFRAMGADWEVRINESLANSLKSK